MNTAIRSSHHLLVFYILLLFFSHSITAHASLSLEASQDNIDQHILGRGPSTQPSATSPLPLQHPSPVSAQSFHAAHSVNTNYIHRRAPSPTTIDTTVRTSSQVSSVSGSASATTSASVSPTPSVDPANGYHVSSYVNGQPVIQVDFNCTIDATFCAKILRAVDTAAQEFTKVVNINVGILLKVDYYNFCDRECANVTIGWGAPTSQFTLTWEDTVDTNYVYPQTLAKQLAYSNVSVWADHDVNIELNHDAYMAAVDLQDAISKGWNGTGVPPGGKFWFEGDGAIEPHQIDMSYIILHELMHGVGFISSWGAYFWTESSPFRSLIDGLIDTEMLQVVTPGPYWYVKDGSGPAFISGFQPTMIFDKFLSIVGEQNNVTSFISLADTSFAMQNFCRRDDRAFIVNFVRDFNLAATVSRTARNLFTYMAEEGTLFFQFSTPGVRDSPYNHVQENYTNMTLLTGSNVMESHSEQFGRINNRPGLAISHVDSSYTITPDFLMTNEFITGQTLQQIVNNTYANYPAFRYNDTLENGTMVELIYHSPIGPSTLRILDSIGYSTVLTRTNYTTEGSVNKPRVNTQCDDNYINSRLTKQGSVPSMASLLFQHAYTLVIPCGTMLFLLLHSL